MPLAAALFLAAERALEARREAALVEAAKRRLVREVDEPARLAPFLPDAPDRLVRAEPELHAQPLCGELARVEDDVEASYCLIAEEVRARRDRRGGDEGAAARQRRLGGRGGRRGQEA